MIKISDKTLQDLEFNSILEQISSHCDTELGKERALAILPFEDSNLLHSVLLQTSEYLSSYENDNRIPNHGFDAINQELKLLRV